MEKMSLKEFEALNASNQISVFELFDFRCKKCSSSNIELFGNCDAGECPYYGGIDYIKGNVVIKCHACGNAKGFKLESGEDLWKIEEVINNTH